MNDTTLSASELREWRWDNGYTIKSLSQKVGISPALLQKIERGEMRVNGATAEKFQQVGINLLETAGLPQKKAETIWLV